jgi:hypothetical protein
VESSPPTSVRNHFTCFPDYFSLRTCHSLNFSRASHLYSNIYSSVCLVASSMNSSLYQPPPMAVSRGPHMSECISCRCSVAREVVGVNGFPANLHLMKLSQSHFPVIFGASVIVGKISKALGPTGARRRCHMIRLSASCPDKCPDVISDSRQLSSILVYCVDPGVQFRMLSRKNSPST